MVSSPRPAPIRGPALATLQEAPALAIQADGIVCLDCGRVLRQLTNTHLAGHGLTAATYRERWGYPRHEGLVCRELQAYFRQRAITTELASRIRRRRLDPQGSLGKRQRRVAIQRRVAATDYAARERGRAVHPRAVPVDPALVRELRATGLSLRAIASQLRCSVATVGRRLGQVFPSNYQPKYRRGG
jgi:predicted transcriptional regulator